LKARPIRPGIDWLGTIDWDRRLFDALIPIPDGTSYNAYLLRSGGMTVLIDTDDPAKKAELLDQLSDVERLDYLIIQHVEQDHSGSAPDVLARYPDLQILCSTKAKPMIIDHLDIPTEKITTVEDGETLSLGDWTLEFIYAPWVHWPETMLTYLREEKVLFTCDLFGSHLATDELFASGNAKVCDAAKRYYAEIMMPFAGQIRGHLERLEPYEIEIVCPSHGPVRDDPDVIIDSYRHWATGPPKNLVLLPYATMHESTALMVDHLVTALAEREIHVEPFNMTVTDIGDYAAHLVDAATVIFATPTVLVGPHPTIVFTAYLTGALRPKLKHAGVIGSFGWGSQAAERAQALCANLKAEWFDPVMTKGLPKAETYKALDALADAIAEKHADLG